VRTPRIALVQLAKVFVRRELKQPADQAGACEVLKERGEGKCVGVGHERV
jgi:hypothetical protein